VGQTVGQGGLGGPGGVGDPGGPGGPGTPAGSSVLLSSSADPSLPGQSASRRSGLCLRRGVAGRPAWHMLDSAADGCSRRSPVETPQDLPPGPPRAPYRAAVCGFLGSIVRLSLCSNACVPFGLVLISAL